MRPSLSRIYAEVPFPTSNVSVNSKGSVYWIGKGYRNANGKPTSKLECIGKKNNETGWLIPNDRYFEIYEDKVPVSASLEVDSIRDVGDYFLLDWVTRHLKLDMILNNVFKDSSESIIALAIYTALEGNVYFYAEDWCDSTYIRDGLRLNSSNTSRLLDRITEGEKMEFFRAWINAREQNEYLAYDITSISTYSESEFAEYGYNRDKDNLAQINLGMYFGEESMIPVYYSIYPGSIPDVTHLQTMLRDNERLGLRKVKLVLDRGNFSSENVRALVKMPEVKRFIIGMNKGQAIPVSYLDKYGKEATSSRYNLYDNGETKGNGYTGNDYGFRAKYHIYYSNEKKAELEPEFSRMINNWEDMLLNGTMVSDNAKEFFVIEKTDDNSFKYIGRNYEQIDKRIDELGFFMIMSTDFEKSSKEILEIYRKKDVIEKCFDRLKNELDTKRLRVHTAAKQDAKLFIIFLAIILTSYISVCLKEYIDNSKSPVTLEKILKELRKIKALKTKNGITLLNPITKKQRDILEVFGINETDILSFLTSG